MDLAVDAQHVAFGPEGDRGVRELLAPLALLGDRAADEGNPVAARPLRHDLDRLAALEWLRGRVEDVAVADRVPLLGEHDDVGAGGGGPGD